MKLLGSTESKIAREKNGENVPHLEVVELVLIHCNIQEFKIQEYYIHLFQANHLVVY